MLSRTGTCSRIVSSLYGSRSLPSGLTRSRFTSSFHTSAAPRSQESPPSDYQQTVAPDIIRKKLKWGFNIYRYDYYKKKLQDGHRGKELESSIQQLKEIC
jgi:hypothetical protein